jgi:SPASM domain peptide maturase of grasp-with-spasm system
MPYQLFGTCVLVNGFLRSAIYDLQKNDYVFVPTEILSILNEPTEIQEQSVINEWLDAELIYEINSSDLHHFTQLDTDYDYPSLISNTVIELSYQSDFNHIIDLMDNICCYNVQLIFVEDEDDVYPEIKDVLQKVSMSAIKHLEIVMPYKYYQSCIEKVDPGDYPEVKVMYVFNAPGYDVIKISDEGPVLVLSDAANVNDPGKKLIDLFSINTALYIESLQYNTYYNRKAYIDVAGNVKNGKAVKKSYGNIYEPGHSLLEIVQQEAFQELSKIKKDNIEGCNVCEFRHMCVDNQIPEKNLNGTWFRRIECNYNPFIAKWAGDQFYLTYAECGVQISSNGISIDYEKLNAVLSGIYEVEEV